MFQRQLGVQSVPPPGYYFDSERNSCFKKKQPYKNGNFGTCSQRVLTIGSDGCHESEKEEEDDKNDCQQETMVEWKKRKYLESIRPGLSEALMTESQPQNTNLDESNSYFEVKPAKTRKHYSHTNLTLPNQTIRQAMHFSTGKKTSFFDSQITQTPGPGTYSNLSIDALQNKSHALQRQDMYFKPGFGTGTKRFLDKHII